MASIRPMVGAVEFSEVFVVKIKGRSRKFTTQCPELVFPYPTAFFLDLIYFIGIRHIGQRMWVQ